MGCYIQGPTKGKYQHILGVAKAARPVALAECEVTPYGDVPVLVIDNGSFEAAMVCYNKDELEQMQTGCDHGDYRPIQCLMVPRSDIRRLLGEAHYNIWFNPDEGE